MFRAENEKMHINKCFYALVILNDQACVALIERTIQNSQGQHDGIIVQDEDNKNTNHHRKEVGFGCRILYSTTAI